MYAVAQQQRVTMSYRCPCLGVGRAALNAAPKRSGAVRRSAVAPKALLEIHAAAAAASTSVLDVAHQHTMLLASLAEGPAAAIADAVTNAASSTGAAAIDVANAAGSATTSATETVSGGGPFDMLAHGFEGFLTVLDTQLERLGVPYSYGWAIILLTVLVKAATFPLSQKQVQSTQALQALAPQVKELQAKYAGEQETIQLETARLYREAGVNPLAGCLPTLATIPVFIGLYRALTMAADDGLLDKGWFWIPSLAGPTSIAARTAGSGFSWLFPFVNGAPPIGWHDAIAYMIMPVALVVSQFVSQKVMAPPPSSDPQAQQTNAILKFLPLLIGYFSLNVPAGLTLYWFTNNILSTAQQLYLKQTAKVSTISGSATVDAASATVDVAASVVRPKEERVKKVSGKEFNARRKKESGEDNTSAPSSSNGASPSSSSQQPQQLAQQQARSESKKGNKFRALKAREAAGKAAASVQPSGSNTTTAVKDQPEPSQGRNE